VERTAPRRDALTAARAATLPLFRELFPGEILTPGQLVSVANVTLLCTELIDSADLYRNLGDVGAFALIHEHFRLISEGIRKEGGAPVKTVAEGLVASFHDSTAALRAALSMLDTLAANEITGKLKVGVAVHRGPALAATMNDHLDYFGSTVSQALQLARLAGAGNVLVSQSLADNTEMASLLEKLDRKREVQTVGVFGNDHFLAQRLYR
jgi:class 3 adenylate cyclase